MTRGRATIAACACALFLVFSAPAQEARPQGQTASEPATNSPLAVPDPASKPGFIDALGRWLEQGAITLKSSMQAAQERFDRLGNQARDSAKEVTGAVVGLPNMRMVTAHERCAPAPNGGPDCQSAANTICRGKGFQAGTSLDTQSEQKCPAKVLLEGRGPNDTECPTEIFVTRAMCQ